ncbi:hypothetical protein [Microcella sp.]|uniref:hypothetical protein n=1 Tax=Microcella sp. TaxID=1913979 RepID=UPI003F6F28F6
MRRPTNTYSGPPRGNGYLSGPVLQLLERTGGIVSTRELRAIGVDPTTLEFYRDRGSLQAVRQGWHCHPSVPEIVRLAWRFGGPLACVSALAFHNAISTDTAISAAVIGAHLHVCLRDNAIGAPSPAQLAGRWGISEPLAPVIHWSSRDAASGDRRAVSRAVALRQADRCDRRAEVPARRGGAARPGGAARA